jgi:hypothetical protein
VSLRTLCWEMLHEDYNASLNWRYKKLSYVYCIVMVVSILYTLSLKQCGYFLEW